MISACSALSNRHDSLESLSPHQNKSASNQISQLGFGRSATFGVCVEPDCPKRTPKTSIGDTVRQVSIAPTDMPTSVITPSASHTTIVKSENQVSIEPEQSKTKSHSEQINLRFSLGNAHLSLEARNEINKALPWARHANRIVISGRTDNIGLQAENDKLALARAIATRNYIRAQIPDVNNIIEIKSKGLCCFIANNNTPHGRAANRRVEVIFNLRS
jgi:outer membrane protein OmpA-like peptidoglycan-associated protein